MSNLKNNKFIFDSISKGIYERKTYPHLVTIVPFNKCFKYVDLLASSINYSLITCYNDRVNYSWPLIKRAMCNGELDNRIYISLVFNKPTSLKDLRVTYINSVDDIKLFPFLKDKVLSNLIQVIRDY